MATIQNFFRGNEVYQQLKYLKQQTLYYIAFQKLVYLRLNANARSSHLGVLLEKGFLKIYSKFTGEYPRRIVILIKLLALRHGCFPVNLLHIFRTPIPKNTSGRLLLNKQSFLQPITTSFSLSQLTSSFCKTV